jgi:hypothetical protein
MDTNKAQLKPFDVYFKQSVALLKAGFLRFGGLYLLNAFLSTILLIVLLVPIVVFAVLSVSARGAILDVYLFLVVFFILALILLVMYLSSVFIKAYYLIISENTSATQSLESSVMSVGGVFKTQLFYRAVVWGYFLVLTVPVVILSVFSYRAGTPALVLTLFVTVPLLIVAMVVLAYFKLAVYVAINQKLTGICALAESYRLIKGNFLGVFGRSLVLGLVIMGLSMLVSVFTMPLTMMGMYSDLISVLAYFVRFLANIFTQFLGGILVFCFSYELYKDLLSQKPQPEPQYSTSKPVLYILAAVGFALLFGGLSFLGYGAKYFIENDGANMLEKYVQDVGKGFEDSIKETSQTDKLNNEVNSSFQQNMEYNLNIQQEITQ